MAQFGVLRLDSAFMLYHAASHSASKPSPYNETHQTHRVPHTAFQVIRYAP